MTTEKIPVAVIGSGPAGITAARALLDQGIAVTMIDAGNTLPPEAQQVHDAMAAGMPADWDRAALAERNRHSLKERDGVPLKTVFGSDYPYYFDPSVQDDGALILGSRARGGLSNAWGASILPLSARDLRNWPLAADKLEPHYAAVMQWLPHAQSEDDLAADYPLHTADAWQLRLSPQGETLSAALNATRQELRANGITFGRSRLAMSNCHYCSQCLHGCPYDFIYSTRSTLNALLDRPDFSYVDSTVITGITEHQDWVELHREGDQPFRAERVYLGTGVLPTALLMMPLLGKRELVIKDSAYGLVPFLRYRREAGIAGIGQYTLPQFYMEIDVPEVSERNVHLQWYGYNDFYKEELRKKLGPLYSILPDVIPRHFVERMWSIQAFLHSDDSPDLLLNMTDKGRASLSVSNEPRTRDVFRAAYRALGVVSSKLGGRVFPSLGRPGTPGGSFHSGGTLPMHETPTEGQTDLTGRPHGLRRVHIVDSSVFPDIASSTITLSVMANAHRIAVGHHLYN